MKFQFAPRWIRIEVTLRATPIFFAWIFIAKEVLSIGNQIF
jgi:hypothetical protein